MFRCRLFPFLCVSDSLVCSIKEKSLAGDLSIHNCPPRAFLQTDLLILSSAASLKRQSLSLACTNKRRKGRKVTSCRRRLASIFDWLEVYTDYVYFMSLLRENGLCLPALFLPLVMLRIDFSTVSLDMIGLQYRFWMNPISFQVDSISTKLLTVGNCPCKSYRVSMNWVKPKDVGKVYKWK